MKCIRRIVAPVLACILAATFPNSVVRATCTAWSDPEEMSLFVERGNLDNCGDTSWELRVAYGYLWDEGEYDATGTCTGGYVKCDCTNAPLGFKTPDKSFSFTHDDAYDATWWWRVTNYEERILNTCTDGACELNGYKSETDTTIVDSNVGWDDESCLL